MAKKRTVSRQPRQQHTLLTRNELVAHSQGLPKSRHGRPFAPDRVPPAFHTVIDPDKHPPQPWRDLPSPTGLPPFRLSLES